MTKRCCDCKHTKGIGYDFWCGEGHTEYEVFGAETDCPYYEYHDWSKGTPSRTKKRFDLVCESNSEWLMKSILYLPLRDNNTNKKITLQQCCDLLNSLEKENEHLKKSIKRQQSSNDECSKLLDDLNDKSQHFKEELKELKEIGDYQAMRIKELEKENRDLEIKVDFYKYFQKDARELEKENKRLTNAIEIMSVNKNLENENEQLKKVLGRILLSVKREISASHKTGEIRAFINPESYDLISDVLRKYGGLKGWYDD